MGTVYITGMYALHVHIPSNLTNNIEDNNNVTFCTSQMRRLRQQIQQVRSLVLTVLIGAMT
jgi:hypothetical protein